MNKFIFSIVFFGLFFFAVDLYFWQAFKSNFLISTKYIRWVRWSYWLTSIFVSLLMFYTLSNFRNPEAPKYLIVVRAFVFSLYIAKMTACFPLLVDDFFRLLKWIYSWISIPFNDAPSTHKISRSTFLKNISFVTGSLAFGILSWGIIFGRFNYKKHRIRLQLKKWPIALNGLKIIQISDLHLGSYTSTQPVEDIVALINEEEADLVVFTGDLINSNYWEANEFIPHLYKIKAKYGKYACMGNHDYADYIGLNKNTPNGLMEWNTNFSEFQKIHEKIGFTLLLNESKEITIGNASFNLIGVENWGAGGFSKYGDLQKAVSGLDPNKCTILLSHDPSHWDAQVRNFSFPINLQLSGHTHGMQFGIELGSFKWSPAKYRYPQWAGLHTKEEKNLYVNRGLGHLGYAGRVGIYPEITVFNIHSLDS